jgi:hypothetical protein
MMEYKTDVFLTVSSRTPHSVMRATRVNYQRQVEPSCVRIEKGDHIVCGGQAGIIEKVSVFTDFDKGTWYQKVFMADRFVPMLGQKPYEVEMIKNGWGKVCT